MVNPPSTCWIGSKANFKQVSRATFTSETLACINTVDSMLVLGILMHQMATGAIRNDEAMKMTEGPGSVYETGVNIDAMSIISALEHVNLKQPSEKSFLAHLAWLQDKILKRAIS